MPNATPWANEQRAEGSLLLVSAATHAFVRGRSIAARATALANEAEHVSPDFWGSFGILDSGRTDVKYEDFQGHTLDRKLLGLLQELV
jgi:hypothetical protein